MKCSKCGRELAPDEKFCGGCGAIVGGNVEEQKTEPETAAETRMPAENAVIGEPVKEAVTAEEAPKASAPSDASGILAGAADPLYTTQGASDASGTYIPSGSSGAGFSYTPPREPEKKPEAPVKKKKIGGLIAILVAAVFVVVLVAVAVFAKDSIMRLLKSPEDYTKYVLRNNLVGNKALVEAYDSARSGKGFSQSTSRYYLNASDEALDDFYSILEAEDVDVDRDEIEFAKEVSLTVDTTADNGRFKLASDITLGGKSAFTADVIYDTDSEEVYFRSKELNEDYAYYAFSGSQSSYTEREFQEMLSMMTVTNEGLPSGKEMSEIWDKYVDIAIDQIEDVEESREKMTAGDVTQKMTVLEIKIDDKLSKNIAVEVLGELKDDDEFKDIMKRAAKSYEPLLASRMYRYGGSSDDFEDELDDWLDDAYKSAKNIKFKDEATLELYVSNGGKIQGVRFAFDDNEFYSLYTEKFGKFGSELRVVDEKDEVMTVVGNGKVSFGTITGTFDIEMPEEDVKFTVGAEGFNLAQMAAGKVNGTLSLDLGQFSKELKEADKEADANGVIRKLADYELKMFISSTGKSSEIKYSLNRDKDEYISAGYSVALSSGDSIEIPSGKKSVRIEDEDDFIEYLMDCDFDGWADELEDCGLPDEVTDAVGEVSDMLELYY